MRGSAAATCRRRQTKVAAAAWAMVARAPCAAPKPRAQKDLSAPPPAGVRPTTSARSVGHRRALTSLQRRAKYICCSHRRTTQRWLALSLLSPRSSAHDDGMASPPSTILGKRRCGDGAAPPVVALQRLPASTPLFRCLPRHLDASAVHGPPGGGGSSEIGGSSSDLLASALQHEAAGTFLFSAPLPASGLRVCEYLLNRPVLLAPEPLGSEDALRQLGCDGWVSDGGSSVLLVTPGALLRLVDDDKQAGRAQAFLTDMFARHGGGVKG
jgi:hypothetical protein